MITVETAKREDCLGVNHETNWLKGIPYESSVAIYDGRDSSPLVNKEKSAYYFDYNEKEQFHLFLRKNKDREVEMYVIRDEKCWVKYWDGDTQIPILDTEYIGLLGKTKRFPNEAEKEYALKRLEELDKKIQ
jgi:hypothetical protein